MKLLIDAGNSRIKSSVSRGEEFSDLSPVATNSSERPADWRDLEKPERVLVSNVAGDSVARKIEQWLADHWQIKADFAQVQENAAGMTTQYEDPSRLGVDRWLAALAGFRIAQGAACVVDAGTAMTIDVVNERGCHMGGSIAPGLSLMVSSLTKNTARLSLDQLANEAQIATNTAAAISSGCIDSVVGGIERMKLRAAEGGVPDPHWFITGGEARTLIACCTINFTHIPNLVQHGLNYLAVDSA